MAGDKEPYEGIGAAMEVHRAVGPGLPESAYASCLAHRLGRRGVPHERDVRIPAGYDAKVTGIHFRIDLVVRGDLIVELRSVERLLPVHQAQLTTYLRLSERTRGLVLNFSVSRLAEGIVRVANDNGRSLRALGLCV